MLDKKKHWVCVYTKGQLSYNLCSTATHYILILYYFGMLNADGHFAYEQIPYRGDSALTDGRDSGVDLTGGYFQGNTIWIK